MCLVSYVSDRLVLRHRGQRRTPTIGLPAPPVETPANAGIPVLLFESRETRRGRGVCAPSGRVQTGQQGVRRTSLVVRRLRGGTVRAGGLRLSGYLRRHRAPPTSAAGVVTIGGSTFKAPSVE